MPLKSKIASFFFSYSNAGKVFTLPASILSMSGKSG
jgi:hypothetical protein